MKVNPNFEKLFTQLRHAVTVIVAFAVLAWFGCPALFNALEPIANVLLSAGGSSLHAMLTGIVMASAALSALGVYRRLMAQDARDREMLLRSLTITGQLPR